MEKSAFAALCKSEWPKLVGLLSLYCGDVQVAEELAQEAITRAWKDIGKLRKAESSRAWLQTIAINLANSHFRRSASEQRARERLSARASVRHEGADATDAIVVRRAVAALPRRQRSALVLRYYADLPVAQVADALGCPEGTVKTLIHRAVKSLRTSADLQDLQEVSDASRHS